MNKNRGGCSTLKSRRVTARVILVPGVLLFTLFTMTSVMAAILPTAAGSHSVGAAGPDRWPATQSVDEGASPQPPQPELGFLLSSTMDTDQVGSGRGAAILATPAAGLSDAAPEGWFENDIQGVHETWQTLGITGTGVTVAVLDSGVDFGNPALAGRYAVQPLTSAGTQAYAGWPVAFDDRSLTEYLAEPERAWPDNWGWYVNADHAITGSGAFTFADPLAPGDSYTATGTSLSERYLLGYHPDPTLGNALLLVADEATGGVYDAVYIDLDLNGSFETRLSREAPVGSLDLIKDDGVPDISAGMLYWIADGANPPPGARAVYGNGMPVPDAGSLLAFMIDTPYEEGGGHGTLCASNVIGDDGGAFDPAARGVAAFYTPDYGPVVQGPAPGAKVLAMGNVYAGGSMESWYAFVMTGYDGVPASGDEPQVVSISFGNSGVDNDGWDWESRHVTGLGLAYGDAAPLFVNGAGNGGFGYGTLISPEPATGLKVGISTQYGTFSPGISETVSLPARVNYGDVASPSSRGTGADGTRSVDLVANGMVGTGAIPLNWTSDGRTAYIHWSMSSRATPVVGGMAALVYQAYRQARGRWPTAAEAKGLLVNGARDLGYDPLVQGAGQADVFRAVQVALGRYGVTVDPPAAVAGDYRGQRYPSFAAGLARGATETLAFTLTNASAVPTTVELDAQRLVEVARYNAALPTLADSATNDGTGTPDYALDLTPWVSAQPDADLMVVRLTVPFEHFDGLPPTPPDPDNVWALTAYNWWDDDADGLWWTDLNSDGRVDWPGEIDGGDEWMRFDLGWVDGTQQEVRVAQPYDRSIGAGSAGIWAGATHITHSAGDNSTVLSFEVIFYQQVAWPEVQTSTDEVHLAAHGQATVQVTVQVPANAAYGLHQGAIVFTDLGRTDLDLSYQPHRILVPLTWQVWPDVAQGGVLGGTPPADGPYDNGRVHGSFNWAGHKEGGDWRFYGFDLQDPPPGSVVLVHNLWRDYPTDLDTLILGPSPDTFSQEHPEWFGPYGLDRVGGTAVVGTPGIWDFSTVTGGTEDWTSAPATDGLHLLANRAILLGGHQSTVPFTTSLGLAWIEPYPVVLDPSDGLAASAVLTLHSAIDLPDGLVGSHAFGWFSPAWARDQNLVQGGTALHSVTVAEAAYRVEVEMAELIGATRLQACLYDDGGTAAGAWDPADVELACTWLPDRTLKAGPLSVGQYWVRILSVGMSSPAATYDLSTVVVPASSDGALSFENLPETVGANQPVTFVVRAEIPFAPGQQALLLLGPHYLTDVIEVPILAQSEGSKHVYLPLVVRSLP